MMEYLQSVLDLLRNAPFVQRNLVTGTHVILLKDNPYNGIVIPKDAQGTIVEVDGDFYFPYIVEFNDYPGAYVVGRRDVESI